MVADKSAVELELNDVDTESSKRTDSCALFLSTRVVGVLLLEALPPLLFFLRRGSSSGVQSRVMYRSKLRGVDEGSGPPGVTPFGVGASIGLQTGVKKWPLCSMLLRISRTRMTSSMAGVRIELESRSIGLHERLSNLLKRRET